MVTYILIITNGVHTNVHKICNNPEARKLYIRGMGIREPGYRVEGRSGGGRSESGKFVVVVPYIPDIRCSTGV